MSLVHIDAHHARVTPLPLPLPFVFAFAMTECVIQCVLRNSSFLMHYEIVLICVET
jgi:hypothetical protein